MKMNLVQIKMKKGAALIYVVIALAVISIFSLIVANLVLSNLQQAKYQERVLQAYYLSVSGSDLCLAALLQEGAGGSQDTLLFSSFNPTIASPDPLTDTLDLDGGLVYLTVTATTKEGERWIVIESKAVLDDLDVSQTTYVEFLYDNPLIQTKH